MQLNIVFIQELNSIINMKCILYNYIYHTNTQNSIYSIKLYYELNIKTSNFRLNNEFMIKEFMDLEDMDLLNTLIDKDVNLLKYITQKTFMILIYAEKYKSLNLISKLISKKQRLDYLMLYEGIDLNDINQTHVTKYLFNDLIQKEICSYITCSNTCTINDYIIPIYIYNLIKNERFTILDWLIEHGLNIDYYINEKVALKNSNKYNISDFIYNIINNKKYKILNWLLDHGLNINNYILS